ncbi:hypothetical protein OROMI_011658 [Orobanche minor]
MNVNEVEVKEGLGLKEKEMSVKAANLGVAMEADLGFAVNNLADGPPNIW